MTSNKNKVYIIAEIGVNHNGSISLAKKLIKKAKECGADAVKFQNFITKNLVTINAPKDKYKIKNTNSKQNQFEMLKTLELKLKSYFILKKFAKKNKIDFITSVFDEESLIFVQNKLKNNIIKIPSGELNNYLLLDKLNKKLKIIISTGMSTLPDIVKAINRIYKKEVYKLKNNKIIKKNKKLLNNIKNKINIMHCVTDYPVEYGYANILSVKYLSKNLGLNVGYSDHTSGVLAPVIAVSLGASIIEKHFTLNQKMKGPDHQASLNPKNFKIMCDYIRNTEVLMGKEEKKIQKCEQKNIKIAKKNIVAKKDIEKGERFTLYNITAKRPYIFLSPDKIDQIINKKAKKKIKINEKIKI